MFAQSLTTPQPKSSDLAQLDSWLTNRIKQLSVEALRSEVHTCTACGEATGKYIITYKGDIFHFEARDTYAFLKFVVDGALSTHRPARVH